MTKVSVVLTSYNKPQWIGGAIESVLNQIHRDFELLILDDNSPDPAVRDIILSYNDDRIKTYFSRVHDDDRFEQNRYSILINHAIRHMSTGDYISYLCDDDYYYPQKLSVMSKHLDNNLHHDIVFSCQQIVDVDGNPSGERRFTEPLKKAWDAVDHNSVMHRRSLYDMTDGWPEGADTWGGADSWFWKSINDMGIIFYPVAPDVPLEAKRYHEDSVQWKIANEVPVK